MAAFIGAAVDVRNICAHYARLYNQAIDEHPVLPLKYQRYQSDRVFPVILMLRLCAGGQRIFRQMTTGIEQLAQAYPEADLSLCGFPDNWKELLLNG